MVEEARWLCRLSWDYVLGYGNHKDPTILTLLKAIEHLGEVATAECRAALNKVAPQIHHITDYTDGDETRHAHSYVNDLLAKLDPLSLAEKYAGHISAGSWSYADEAFAARFDADLASPLLEAIARTGLPSEAMSNLHTRAKQGDMGAAKLYDMASLHKGAAYRLQEKPTRRDDSLELKKFQSKPEDYRPEKFDSLVQDMRESGSYSAYPYLPKWYEYWSNKGHDAELLRIVEPRVKADDCRRDDVYHMLDQAFESCFKLNGKYKAFQYAVQAQKEMGGWSDFYEPSEISRQRLQRVADLYPDRADEFIKKSCFTWLRSKRQPSARVIPDDKLVFFLARLGRVDEANALVAAMVAALQDDTRNLPLTSPSWAKGMAPTGTLRADIRLLVARTKWPVPAVKWWAMQELASLLVHPLHRDKVEIELYRELELSKLETEVVELLFVFWLAKQAGYVPGFVISTYVNARSPASSLILTNILNPLLQEGAFRSSLVVAPYKFEPTAEFQEAQGMSVPEIFRSLLKILESASGLPFLKQFAFEWANTKTLYPDAPLQQDIRHFYGLSVEQMTGQFVIKASHRGRSAYLRTLSVAKDAWGAPDAIVNRYAVVGLPLDPTLAALRPLCPAWIPAWHFNTKVERQTVDEFLYVAMKQLRETSPDAELLALSLPLHISETKIVELELVRWAQWDAISVDGRKLLERANRVSERQGFGWCEAAGLAKTMLCPVNSLDNILDPDVSAAPTAGEPSMWRRGYLHSDLYSRGILMPLSTVETVPVSARPHGHELEVLIGDSPQGRWSYWNAGWDTSHPRLAHAFCATALIADKTQLNMLWNNPPIRHLLLWRCSALSREAPYSEYSKQEVVGVYLV